jgi:protein-disulfide isomerase
MKKQLACLILGLVLCFSVQQVFSQTAEEKTQQKDIDELKAGQVQIQKDIQDIKKQLQAKPAPPGGDFKEAMINIKGAPVMGGKNAKLVLIEFSDYQCPFCGRHGRDTDPQIQKEYIDTGKMKLVFMDFPLDFHQYAFKAAVASLCAGDQGKYWEMHAKLFNNPNNDPAYLGPENIMKYAEEFGLKAAKFKECLDSGKHDAEIKQRQAEGQTKAGITGTPAFLLGYIQPDGTVKATKKIVGAGPYANFKAAIDEQLSAGK